MAQWLYSVFVEMCFLSDAVSVCSAGRGENRRGGDCKVTVMEPTDTWLWRWHTGKY